MKSTMLNLLCVIIICATGTLCVLIHSEYSRYSLTGTSDAKVVHKLDKRTGMVWQILLTKATIVTGDEIDLSKLDFNKAEEPPAVETSNGVTYTPVDYDPFADEKTE